MLLRPGQSPSRAQHAAAAATAAGLTPRGVRHRVGAAVTPTGHVIEGINVQEYEDQGLSSLSVYRVGTLLAKGVRVSYLYGS